MEKQLSLTDQAKATTKERVKSLRKDLADAKVAGRRMLALAAYLESRLPQKIKARMEISFTGYGIYIYATIRPKYKRFTENDTLLITAFIAGNEKWKFEKRVYESTGRWYHVASRYVCKYNAHYEIEFNHTSDIDGCELVEQIETREVKTYVVKCPE